MTAPAPPPPAPKTKQKRKDAYMATVKIGIPLDMANADSLANAIKAVEGLKASLPANATFDLEARLGKI